MTSGRKPISLGFPDSRRSEAPGGRLRRDRIVLWRRDESNVRLFTLSSTRRTAVCGPACTVVWEGRTSDRPPYPDCRLVENHFPIPLKTSFCGLPEALSVTETVPFRFPEVLGENVMLSAQLPPPAILPPHVLVCEKLLLA